MFNVQNNPCSRDLISSLTGERRDSFEDLDNTCQYLGIQETVTVTNALTLA